MTTPLRHHYEYNPVLYFVITKVIIRILMKQIVV